ncbi:MAG: TPM domain-containing protein [Paracoccaceae bacterium]
MWKWLLLALFLPLAAWAQGLPQPLSDRVSDYDNLLSPAEEARLGKVLAAARAETGVHVAVVAMARRESHGGEGRSIEDYARLLFNRWGVGDKARNDGILILVASDDREMRVQLGSGYGGAWDGVAQGVVDRNFLPAFRDGRYGEGIEAGTQAVIETIARPFAAGQPPPETAPMPAYSPPSSDRVPQTSFFGSGWLVPLMLVASVLLMARRFIGDAMVRLKPCPQCGQKGLRRIRHTLSAATEHSSGEGEMITSCEHCDYRLVEYYTIPQRRSRDDSDSGSGSSGFGGGRSSGGGATGRW